MDCAAQPCPASPPLSAWPEPRPWWQSTWRPRESEPWPGPLPARGENHRRRRRGRSTRALIATSLAWILWDRGCETQYKARRRALGSHVRDARHVLRARLILTAERRATILVTSSYNVGGFNHLGPVAPAIRPIGRLFFREPEHSGMDAKALLDSLDVGVAAVAPDWTIAEWSAGASRVTG